MSDNLDFNLAKQEFDSYYTQMIFPKLQQIEQMRKKMLYRFYSMVSLVAAWLGFIFWRHFISPIEMGNNIPVCIDIAGCIAVLLAAIPMFSYYRQSKESLLPLLAGFFGSFKYSYQKNLSEDVLSYSKIMKTYDKISTDDCFEGIYDNIPVKITEYALYKKRYVRNKGQTRVITYKVSSGILFSAKMNKKFNGQTIVVKDKGWLNKLVHYKKMRRVGLESPEFEKAFEVYSEDQIEARYLLTTVMLEYMLEAKKIYPNITFSFFNNEVLINIETNKNFFECSSFFRTMLNKKRIEQNFTELYFLFSIIKTLRLNQTQIL